MNRTPDEPQGQGGSSAESRELRGSGTSGEERLAALQPPLSPGQFAAKRREWTERTRRALPGIAVSYAAIAIGCLVMAAGYSFFMIPQKIAPGGVYGLATVVHYATGAMGWAAPVGLTGLLMNIPLFLWGLRALGVRFASRTIFGIVAASLFMDALTYAIPHVSGLEAQVASLNPMLASGFGGLAIGAGLGLIFRHMGSTGGSDIVSQVLGQKTNISVGVWMMAIDAAVVALAAFYFKDINLSLYAIVTIFVCGRVIDTVLEGQSSSRAVTIISEKLEPIREAILFGIGRTGTLCEGTGLFRGRQKNVILCVVNRKNLIQLERLVAQADPEAFLVVAKAHEVLGEGFKPLRDRLRDQAGGI
jgi:uncharacterized membrane-anchored protein YitT (DUF2179 family)